MITQKLHINWSLIILYILLICLGWMSVYSSSYNPQENFNILEFNSIYSKQLLFMASSLIIGFFILLIDIKALIRLSYLIYFLCIVSLILVLFIGKEVGGAKAWFDFGKFGLQPAEFAKCGTILAIAKFMHDKNIYLNKNSLIIKVIGFILLPVILILQQPDAGSALVYGSLIIMFFREGILLRYVIIGIMTILLGLSTLIIGVNKTIIFLIFINLIFAYLLQKNKKSLIPALISFILCTIMVSGINYTYESILPNHQKERIDLIIGKEANNLGSGYNLNQSLIAIGSGGFFGKGYLNGTQTKFNFVPEQNTDFIFCTIGEEFGFMGSLFVIILFIVLISKIIFLSEKQTSRFSRIIGYSVASILFAHVFINISMTLGLMPVIGIPLPFFSSGGSSLLSFSILLFLFIKLDTYRTSRF